MRSDVEIAERRKELKSEVISPLKKKHSVRPTMHSMPVHLINDASERFVPWRA